MSALEALQTTLAAEHAALYVYGVLGGQTSETGSPVLFAALQRGYDVHRTQRDELTSAVRDLGAEPVAAEPAYEVAGPVGSAVAVAQLGLEVERRCATTYAALVAETVDEGRAWATTALTGAAARQLDLGGEPVPLPGLEPTGR